MRHAKYIVVNMPGQGEVVLIFPASVEHKRVATPYLNEVVSAGFVQRHGKKFTCYGESFSLDGLQSRPKEDAMLVELMLGEDPVFVATPNEK